MEDKKISHFILKKTAAENQVPNTGSVLRTEQLSHLHSLYILWQLYSHLCG